ncbi:MAG: DUF2145 domain-containing protein [Burkholderiales bacterium]|nr:DUF2145 domain-containing protein [Burkholderiales bacterium]
MLAVLPAWAGRSCEPRALDATQVIKAMDLAYQSRIALDKSGAQVAFIARVGQDLSKYNLRYSHMAIVWRDHPQGQWLVVHELNACGTALSDLYDEGLGSFFLDDMFAYETKIVIPEEASQARLVKILRQSNPEAMHEAKYNMVAYAFSSKYQNSNQWVLETYASAQMEKENPSRNEVQAWLKQAGYQASTLEIPMLTRLGGRMFRANVAFDDHPFDRRMAGHIDAVTVDSVYRFIAQREPQMQVLELKVK